jgi:serine/threonine protein kinase
MEYLEGETLEELLRQRGKLSPKEAVRIAFLAALGLQHICEQGMVHRDLKPGNLMLCPAPGPNENTFRSMVKILDIGLGRTLFDPKSQNPGENLTQVGSILGTPDYLAPEQATDARRADIRSDIYGLGCTLYHALTGQPPFPDNNPLRLVLRHANEPPRPLSDFDPEIPAELDQIVATMMAKNPAQRFQTPGQVANALKAFLAAEAIHAKPVAAELPSYLEWLKKPAAVAPRRDPEVTPPIFPLPDKAPKPVIASQPLPTAEKILKIRLRKTKLKRIVAAHLRKEGILPPAGKPRPLEVNVEPVAARYLARARYGARVGRDLLMLLLGACSVLAVVALLWLLTYLFPEWLRGIGLTLPDTPPHE